jgi:lipoprotein-anchoring transpeptidase ErfK/SrfK
VRRAAAVGVLLLAGCGEQRAAAPPAPTPSPFAAVGHVAQAAAPAEARPRWRTARVTRRAALRARPGGRVVARIGTRTEFGSPRVLGVTGRRGRWLRVFASERPNGRAAWIPAAAARLGATDVSIRIDRSRRRLTVRRGERVLRRLPVAVGRPGTPTPLGRFAVTDRLRSNRADSPYGCCAIALSGHQTKLLDGWPGGDRLAVHGTPNEETIGEAISLGCLRAAWRDMRMLMRTVPRGTPVFIRA